MPRRGETTAKEVLHVARGRAPVRDARPLLRLLPLMLAHPLHTAMSLICMLGAVAAQLGLSVAARAMVDTGMATPDAAALARSFGAIALVVAALALFSALRLYFAQALGDRVVTDLRRRIFDHVLTLDVAHFLKVRMNEVLARLTADMTIVDLVIGNAAHIAVRSLVLLVCAVVMLAVVNPGFAALVVLVLPVALSPLLLFGRKVRRLSRTGQDRFSDAMGIAGESLDALETVQAFGQEAAASERFRTATRVAQKANLRRIRARAILNGLLIVLAIGGVLGLLFQATLDLVVHRRISGGELLQLLVLASMAGVAVRDLGDVWGDLQRASGALERVGEILDAQPAIAAPAAPAALPSPARGEIAFERVSFSYPGREELPALKGFSLQVRPGERVALVGPSGAGKSTVLRLLLRFYDPTSGTVSIDGVDLRTADPREVRSRMALVAQDAALFSGSAAENIRFGRPDATPEEIRAVAAAAQAKGFLSRLPEGFDTPIGERGKTLSGGQRQRLAIARALVRDAPILLLDEATSSLDAVNERMVQQALHEAMTGRTTLVIAHRLSTVLEADRIVVMDHGRVVEEGRHADLMERGGLYARVARLQFGADAA